CPSFSAAAPPHHLAPHSSPIRSISGQVVAAAGAGPGSGEEELQHARARARAAAELEASLSLACSRRPAVDLAGSGAGPLLAAVLLRGLPRSSAPPLHGEISRPAGARPAASAADLARAGRSSRGGGGPPHWRWLPPSAASMADLYPQHPLLRRWRCGGGREQRGKSTFGVDLAVAEQRTSGGHLRRPPPHLLLAVGDAIPPPLLPPSSPRACHDRGRSAPRRHSGGWRADGLAERMTYAPRLFIANLPDGSPAITIFTHQRSSSARPSICIALMEATAASEMPQRATTMGLATGSLVEAGLCGGALLSCVLTSVDTTLASGISPWRVGAVCPCFAAASRPGARGAARSGRLISSIDNSSMADVRVLVAEGAAGYHLPDHFSGTESGYEIPDKARQCHVATLQL
ncbi:unnamed protein product, partial [Urochloa humidicola]